jgi:hypothetical protein
MKKKRIFHWAFRCDYSNIMRVLQTEVHIGLSSLLPNGGPKSFKNFEAIWDTGAMGSVITMNVVKTLGISPTGKMQVAGVNNIAIRDTYIVDIGLPNRVAFRNVNVTECDIAGTGIDVLIGMDLISSGDFAISNGGNKTIFSYCHPSHKTPIDLLERSNIANLSYIKRLIYFLKQFIKKIRIKK